MSVTALLLAGGFGTRARSVDHTVPKPLIKVSGRAVILRQIDLLLAQNIERIVVLAGYMSDILENALRIEYGTKVHVVTEPRPLGTGGCLSLARPFLSDLNLVISADLIFEMDLGRLIDFHQKSGSLLTLTTHPNGHPLDSDLIVADPRSNRISRINTRPHPLGLRYFNLVNASIAVVDQSVWKLIPDDLVLNFEKDLVTKCLVEGLPVYSYRTTEYISDMGTAERFTKVTKDIESGLTFSRSLRQPQKAIFLDRDGVLNVYKGDVYAPDQIELEAGVIESLKSINRSEYLAIMVTNQPHAAKGFCSVDDIMITNMELETLLGNEGAKLDDVYICLHHPQNGFPGEDKSLKVACECRKPAPGMIFDAANKYHIDLSQSYLIGDSNSDILAGKNAGVHTILVASGLARIDSTSSVKPDYLAKNFTDAVDWINTRN